jgi:hypothetical protein
MRRQANDPPLDEGRRDTPLKVRWLGAAVGAAISLAPVCAYAGDAQSPYSIPLKAPPSNGYLYPGSATSFIASWLDMVSATQAAQPNWMMPLVTVTPRLEQEFRFDFYDQQNGTGKQGNGQNIVSYGGPGGARLELIPAWNWEVIVAPPPYATASGPKGSAEGWGDWPAFLVKYRLLSANKDNGDYIVTAFFQMSDPLGTPGKISNNVLTAQPTIAFGKGWAISIFNRRSVHHIRALPDRHGQSDPADQPDRRRRLSGGGHERSGGQKQLGGYAPGYILVRHQASPASGAKPGQRCLPLNASSSALPAQPSAQARLSTIAPSAV